MRSWVVFSLAVALSGTGCSSTRLADPNENAPTLLRLSPTVFLGDVPCSPGATGALAAYTVELYELSAGADAGFNETRVATSPPVSCRSAVFFQALGFREYVADIHGYDQATIEDVQPRWQASCGRGPDGAGPALSDAGSAGYGPVRAAVNATVPIVGCSLLRGTGLSPGQASVSVGLDAATLGALSCGTAPGQVSDFVAELGGEVRSAACSEEVTFSNVALGTELVIRVEAFSAPSAPDGGVAAPGAAPSDAGAGDAAVSDASVTPASDAAAADGAGPSARVPQWTTLCVATAAAGVTTRASCEPLSPVSN